jgi:large subunit ribosomal protein L5
MNPMQEVRIEKVTLNIGVGEGGDKLLKAEKVLGEISGRKPIRTTAKKTIRDFSIRKGEPVGCKVTLRGKESEEMLRRLLGAVEKRLNQASFDDQGDFSYGIKEHIDIPGIKYDPDIGIFGMDVCVSLCKPGYRIKYRRRETRKIPRTHRVKKDEAINFMSSKFSIQVI